MTSLEMFYMKNATNEHSFPLVTHMAYFDTRFGRYGVLKTKQGAKRFWTLEWNPRFRDPKQVNNGEASLQIM
jgi:hypothetical protein